MAESGASVSSESDQIHIQLFGCLDDFTMSDAGSKHRFHINPLGVQLLGEQAQLLFFSRFRFRPNFWVKGLGRGGYNRMLEDVHDIEFSHEALSQGDRIFECVLGILREIRGNQDSLNLDHRSPLFESSGAESYLLLTLAS